MGEVIDRISRHFICQIRNEANWESKILLNGLQISARKSRTGSLGSEMDEEDSGISGGYRPALPW